MFYASENYCFLKKKALGFLDSLTGYNFIISSLDFYEVIKKE
jgi:hypothetical protein